MTVDNETFLISEGILPPGLVYRTMQQNQGFSLYDPSSSDSITDMSTLVTFGTYDLEPYDTFCVAMILVNSKTGLAYLTNQVDDAIQFMTDHPEIACAPLVCDCIPGDANNSGKVDVGDAVYIVNYVFKGMDEPAPYTTCSCDAQGDCSANVGDAVYLINYIFKSGAAPIDCEAWIWHCGWPLR